MTSSTLVRLAGIDKELEAARCADDVPSMQRLLFHRQRLMEAEYGKLA